MQTACDHCGREFPAAVLVPALLRGAATMNGHLLNKSGGDDMQIDICVECFGLIEQAPIGEIFDLRDPQALDDGQPPVMRL